MAKKIATPTSAWETNPPSGVTVRPPAWTMTTAMAAMARSASTSGNRGCPGGGATTGGGAAVPASARVLAGMTGAVAVTGGVYGPTARSSRHRVAGDRQGGGKRLHARGRGRGVGGIGSGTALGVEQLERASGGGVPGELAGAGVGGPAQGVAQ